MNHKIFANVENAGCPPRGHDDSLFSSCYRIDRQLGSALVKTLLSRGHHAVALTRNPNSASASHLRDLGAEIVSGSMEIMFAMTRAIERADAVFLITTPFESGVHCEARQGLMIIDCATKVGLRHLIYFSLPKTIGATGVPFFDGKAIIEPCINRRYSSHNSFPKLFLGNLSGPFQYGVTADQQIGVQTPQGS